MLTTQLWYRPTSKCLGMPLKMGSLEKCSQSVATPWYTSARFSSLAPNTSPMAWWPRHTPSMGLRPA